MLAERISGGLLIFIFLVLVAMSIVGWLAVPLVRHRQYLRKIRARLSSATSVEVLWQAFDKHIQRMTGMKTKQLQHAELAQELSHYIANKDLLFSVQHFLDTLDSARFGKQGSSVSIEELREQAVRIVAAWH
jgi:hypothetical protein